MPNKLFFIFGLNCPKDANGMANSEDSDHTALEEQSDLGCRGAV